MAGKPLVHACMGGQKTVKKGEPEMKLPDIKKKAKTMGVEPGKMKKAELILAIQRAEGNAACFGTGSPACPYLDCCWREDCLGSN